MNPSHNTLPEPGADELAHSERLAAHIRTEIENHGGRIPFTRFMELALYAPGLGYYSAGLRKFGEGGDFITAPEISPLFSRCLARQCAQVIQTLGQADILEFGAGSGIMAADMLMELERLEALPGNYFILEVSAELRARQRDTLMQHSPQLLNRVQWLDVLPAAGFRGVVVANEVMDAMPVHRFYLDGEETVEWYVVIRDGRFAWEKGGISDRQLAAVLEEIKGRLPEECMSFGYTSEVNLAAQAWIESLAQMMAEGVVLLMDYGFPHREYYHPQRNTGTLMCHYRQRAHDDPLIFAGLQDITTHVDFTAIAEAAHEAGLDVAGYTTQAYFLLATGLMEMAAEVDAADTRRYLMMSQQIKKLTLPHEMGELFKVMALIKDYEQPLMGFGLGDMRNKL